MFAKEVDDRADMEFYRDEMKRISEEKNGKRRRVDETDPNPLYYISSCPNVGNPYASSSSSSSSGSSSSSSSSSSSRSFRK